MTGAVRTVLCSWFNAHRDGSSPKVNRQNLHLDERADETGLGKMRGLHPCFTQGQFSRMAEGLHYGSKAQQVSRQAKPCRPVHSQQSLSNVLGCGGSAVLLAPPVRAVCASSFGAPAEHAVLEELTDIAGRGASTDTAPARDLCSLRDHRGSSASLVHADGIFSEKSALVDQVCAGSGAAGWTGSRTDCSAGASKQGVELLLDPFGTQEESGFSVRCVLWIVGCPAPEIA